MVQNIIEKYIEVNKQFIILISGLPGCGKRELGENIERDFKFKLLNTYSYYKSNYNTKIKLKNSDTDEEIELINWYSDDAIDWSALNNDINKYKGKGVVVIGMSLPKDKIQNEADYHVHLNISKQISMEKTQEYITKNKDKYPEEYEIIGTPIEKLKMNKLIFPYYLETTKLAKINKYITIKEMNDNEIYDLVFDLLMKFIQESLDKNIGGNNAIKKTKQNDNINIELELLDQPKYSYDDEINLIKKIENGENSSDVTDSSDITDSSDSDSSDSSDNDAI